MLRGALAASLLVLAAPRLAAARPDPPVINGSTATCTGDQHLGIASGIDFQTPPILNLYVNSLTTDITPDNGVAGISMLHQGANGGNGSSLPLLGGNGGNGDLGQNLTVNFAGGSHAILTQGGNASGIFVQSAGGKGGNGGDGIAVGVTPGIGGAGGDGGGSGAVTITSNGPITTSGSQANGILAQSQGGNGGQGGLGEGASGLGGGIGGNGGAGGNSGAVTVTSSSVITTQGEKASGIFALSQAGAGGKGGDAFGIAGVGGNGGVGGAAGAVTVTSHGAITTFGAQAQGIAAQSLGGAGGDGGTGAGIIGQGGAALGSGPGGRVEVTSTGAIETSGAESDGIFAQSVGGFAGSSGGAGGLVAFGASGESGGSGDAVTVTNSGAIRTLGAYADAILAQSIGGGGGTGGGGVAIVGLGGSGGSGGNGGAVTVTNNAQLQTQGQTAYGIFAQSVGGGGGNGGYSVGLVSIGGSGSSTSDGGSVTVTNIGAITSTANAILAQSVGGGGGSGGTSVGIVAIGGSGGGGGNGGAVAVNNSGALSTSEENASAIFAQSVGGGGGHGGGAVAAGFQGSVAIGGSAGVGSAGNTVTVINNAGGNITTAGDSSHGILAQSLGGGGGHGGYAVSVTAAGQIASTSVAIGGTGGGGGSANTVKVQNYADITTQGENAHGIFAQSVGGGGGDGGFSIADTSGLMGNAYQFAVAVGGKGGDGGNGGAVTVVSDQCNLITLGDHSSGILAQSVGGGGGDGGFTVASNTAIAGSIAVNVAVGGSGGSGGAGNTVSVTNGSSITTQGNNSIGLLAQSVGGGGGSGGATVAAAISTGDVGVAVGGSGGAAGAGGKVSVSNAGTICTDGNNASGILAQSVGGSGGNGGLSVAGAITGNITPTVSVGGAGGTGNSGNEVTVTNTGVINTLGEDSQGILAQSVGGSGGTGGLSVSASGGVLSLATSVGGSGGSGGNGNKVTVNNTNNISTEGNGSQGILAQSIGGGGGNGGSSVSGTLDIVGGASVSVGASGGSGGNGLDVTVNTSGTISTSGDNAAGILAQSVGGGGGNGGFSVAASGSILASASVSVGGSGGTGGTGGAVNLASSSSIFTQGSYSDGILAQSVGGGGGNGGWSVSGSVGMGVIPEIPVSAGVAVSVGGKGGTGGAAGAVHVTSNGEQIATVGETSRGIFAQSVGGGGGNGGWSGAIALAVNQTAPLTLAVSVGGSGGSGNTAGLVEVNSSSNISTRGNDSQGILAQSVGGGGGNGAFSGTVIATATPEGTSAFGLSLSVGGNGGSGGSSLNDPTTGYAVMVNSTGSLITTAGTDSTGILAQSIGGGGGNGGISLNVAAGGSINLTDVPISSQGCKAGGGGNAGAVLVEDSSNILTTGDYAYGILAQSVGGGGGTGGTKISGSVGLSASEKGASFGVSLGASGEAGGGGGNADAVAVTESLAPGASTKVISTQGLSAAGILAQSIGGGGGAGGFSLSGGLNVTTAKYVPSLDFNCGSKGGAGGAAGRVSVASVSSIQTLGESSQGILAQSVGGGGGNGGIAIGASVSAVATFIDGLHVSMGGDGGSGGNGAQVMVSSNGAQILTAGNSSAGILAQSVGGGGGTGGGSIALSIGAEVATVPPVSLSFGGKGGSGGSAGDVTVTSRSSIYTGTVAADTGNFKTGNDSQGILAQSLGGGGGNGGFSIIGNTTVGSILGGATLSFGGTGGNGNTAGAVNVTSTGAMIRTLGDRSQGILAQSLGGGGGNGGFSVAGGLNSGIQLSVSDGGSGGTGANAGTVTVINASSISTGWVDPDESVHGQDSAGILAQSIGGGGGNGAFSISGAVGLLGAPSLSLGGNGAQGGNGAGVTITNTGAAIITMGDRAAGICGQSVGGGGGNAGFSVAGGLSGSLVNLALTYGSNGGLGGNAGAVTINSAAADGIQTIGNDSQGILAQSIGGGGGNGAFSVAGDLTLGLGLNFSCGSSGGSGGNGGAVTVTDTGALLVTSGERAAGIQAQSIGGGGGSGGFGVGAGFSAAGGVGLSFGGAAGTNGAGGTVAVTTSSSIYTSGNDSTGILAQSIGGGGGVGGVDVGGDLTGATSVDLALGASGTGGGNGNNVAIVDTGKNIITLGDRSSGILAQSIGGGGGVSWVGVSGAVQATSATLTIGGQNGASGDAGLVSVKNSSNISVAGVGSYGILAQSIGGGGGVGSNAALTSSAGVTIGGGAGVSGNGGTVNVTNTGWINTEAVGSYGIIAQSIGGGGGLASYAGTGSISGVNTSMPQGGGTNSGNGNTVAVTNAGVITTTGDGAAGIVAQSTGGGGGLNVTTGNGGSAGGVGSSGAITISNSGGIYTTGIYAHGILAQSVSGASSGGTLSSAGDININVSGQIQTQGQGANGIYAVSTGDAGNGNISVIIAQTGSVYCASQSATAVKFVDGKDNLLQNYGLIQTPGYAVTSTDGANTTINNYGGMYCSVQLGQGTNVFNNMGTFQSGAVVNLGAGNTLTNSGRLAIGEQRVATTTALTGNFVQTGSGILQVDLDRLNLTADELLVSGSAKVDGRVGVSILNPGFIKPGSHQDTILSAAGGLNFTGSSLAYNSAVMQSQLFVLNATDLVVSSNVNFNPAGLNKNQAIMGDYINRLLNAGGGQWLDSLLAYHLGIANIQSLGAAYDTLLPYLNEADTLTTIQINRQYLRTFQNRMEGLRPGLLGPTNTALPLTMAKPVLLAYNGPNSQLGQFLAPQEPASIKKRTGLWFDGFSQFGNSSANGYLDFNYIMAGGCVGLDHAFTDRLVAGVGGGFSNTNLNLEGNWGHSNFGSGFATLYGTYFTDKAYLESVLTYGRYQYHNNHVIDLGTSQLNASSSHAGDSFSSVFEGGYTFRPKGFVIQPFTALSYIYLNEGSYQESGAGGIGLQVGNRQSNDLSSEVGARLTRPVRISKGTLVPEVKAAWLHDFRVDKLSVPAAFQGAPNVGFAIDSRNLGANRAELGAQLTFINKAGISASLRYDADLGSNFNSQTITGQLRFSF